MTKKYFDDVYVANWLPDWPANVMLTIDNRMQELVDTQISNIKFSNDEGYKKTRKQIQDVLITEYDLDNQAKHLHSYKKIQDHIRSKLDSHRKRLVDVPILSLNALFSSEKDSEDASPKRTNRKNNDLSNAFGGGLLSANEGECQQSSKELNESDAALVARFGGPGSTSFK